MKHYGKAQFPRAVINASWFVRIKLKSIHKSSGNVLTAGKASGVFVLQKQKRLGFAPVGRRRCLIEKTTEMETMKTLKEQQNQRKAKGGRPQKPVKRQRMVCVRFTKSEHFIAAQRAEKAKLSLSDYIRESSMKAIVKARLSDDDRHFFRQLTSLSNNLNQLTKLAHQKGLFTAMMHFGKELKQIDELLSRFKK